MFWQAPNHSLYKCCNETQLLEDGQEFMVNARHTKYEVKKLPAQLALMSSKGMDVQVGLGGQWKLPT